MSVSINLDLQGTAEFSQALNRFDAAMQNRVQQALTSWAQSVQNEAERLVPVRTGYLQSTIYAKSQQWQIEVGAQATYAASVEFGTRYSQAKPYLQPAIDVNLPSLEAVLLEALDSAKAEAQL